MRKHGARARSRRVLANSIIFYLAGLLRHKREMIAALERHDAATRAKEAIAEQYRKALGRNMEILRKTASPWTKKLLGPITLNTPLEIIPPRPRQFKILPDDDEAGMAVA